ncbi:MAG: hypothetical protein C5B51_00750 [Terriglobia bacterium]|nr:MAG: hypothetical protein C5B51_00750 [Terriglobia bacterium]
MLRRLAAWFALGCLLIFPAHSFDTRWHLLCSQKVGEQFGFTEHAWKIMQLGNFSADFFGPVSEYASKGLNGREVEALAHHQDNNRLVRGAALFLHFDNLNGDFRSNSDFDFLFSRLLETTQKVLASYNDLRIDDRTRKTLTLVTLGASLHAVQDFYSHSDWTHNSFDQPSGTARVPAWFEYRQNHGEPDQWPLHVQSGIYPPVAGALNTHTHMNHDNSRLLYTESENPGQPLRSQAEYHDAGLAPARGDNASDLAHQQLAVNTAIAGSIEWVGRVEENAGARMAIDSAKGWILKSRDAKLAKELEAGLLTEMALSCIAGKWDGDGNRDPICRSAMRRGTAVPGAGGGGLESEIVGLAANLLLPFALKYTGMFWDIHGQYHVLERLADQLGSDSGHYGFKK